MDATYGTAGFLETLTFQGTARRPPAEFILEVENLGAYLGSRSSREETVYHVNCFRKDVPQAVDIIADLLQNFKLESAAVENVRTLLVNQLEDVSMAYSEDHEALVMEHLHTVAYQGKHSRSFFHFITSLLYRSCARSSRFRPQ
jgi:processing peptidase subunit beta